MLYNRCGEEIQRVPGSVTSNYFSRDPMSNRPSRIPLNRRCRPFLFGSFFSVILVLTGSASRPRADVLILKDGYAIHGKLNKEKMVITDPRTGQDIVVEKGNGFTTIDDGARFTIFSASYKAVGDVNNFNKFQDDIRLTHEKYVTGAEGLRKILIYRGQTEFNAGWRRDLTFGTDERAPVIIKQQLVLLTPHYVMIDSTTHLWRRYYLTRELGYERVRKLLSTHPELIEKKGQPDVDKRGKIIRFLIQADWLNEAEDEIKQLVKDLPQETKRAEDLRKDILEIRQERLVADVERAKDSGRHSYALATLKKLPPNEQLPRKLADKVLAIKVEYESSVQKFNDAKRAI